MFDRAGELGALYARATESMGSRFTFYETGTMAGAKPIRRDTLQMLPTWLTAKPRRDIYMLNLESGEEANEPTDCNFYFVADEDDEEPMGALRIGLPINTAEDPERYIGFIVSLIGNLPFESGHAGYAFNWDSRGDYASEAMELMADNSRKYNCIDFFDFDVTLVAMRESKPSCIKSVAWLTLLGKDLVQRSGGVGRIAEALGEGLEVSSLPTGALVRIGHGPIYGSIREREDLSLYARANAFFRPFRVTDHQALFEYSNGNPDATEIWLSRFDEL